MFRKKDKNQGIPDGVVGNNLKNARLTKKEREENCNYRAQAYP